MKRVMLALACALVCAAPAQAATAGGAVQNSNALAPGDKLTITGYNAADKTAGTATWNLYSDAAHMTQVGQSKFSLELHAMPGMSGATTASCRRATSTGRRAR